jgi:predicted phage terminase large subunit-like protein
VARRSGAHVHILDRFKAKASFVETLHAIRQMRAKYPETRAVLIEDAANGPAVVSTLHKEIPGILAVTPEGGKQSRAAAVQPQIESGQVFLPRPRFADGQLRFDYAWVEDFIEQCSMFPKGEHDDDVDALSQLLVYLQKRPVGQLTASQILAIGADDRDDDDDDDDDGGSGGAGGRNQFGGVERKWRRQF